MNSEQFGHQIVTGYELMILDYEKPSFYS